MVVCAALLLGACSSTTDNAASDPSTPAATDAISTATDAPVDKAALVAAVARLGETPHRAESFFLFPGDAEPDDLDLSQPMLAMEFDGTWSRSVGLLGPNQTQGEPTSYTITDRKLAYFYTPGLPDLPNPAFAANPLFAARDEWIVVDVEALNATGLSDMPMTINQSLQDEIDKMVASLADASPAVEGPRSASRGVETRTFEMTIESGPEDSLFARTEIVTIHLDDQGRVREVVAANETFGGGRTEFFDFDAEIVIEPPEGAIDMTKAVLDFMAPQSQAVQLPMPTATPTPTPAPAFTGPTILNRIDEQPELSIFRELIAEGQGVELMLDLPNPEPWTIFAPTNDALEALGPALDELRSEPLRARTFVLEHVVKGSYSLDELAGLQSVISFAGWSIRINSDNGQFTVGSLRGMQPVLVGDLVAGDGVVHILTHTLNTPVE